MANTINSNLLAPIIAAARETLSEEMTLLREVIREPAYSRRNGLLQAKKGKTIELPVPESMSTSSVSAGNTPPDPSALTVRDRSVTLDTFEAATFYVEGETVQNYDLDGWFGQQVLEAVRAVAYSMNADLLGQYLRIPTVAGTAGSGFFASNPDGLADVDKQLTTQLCPQGNRTFVASLKDYAALLKLSELQQANYRGDAVAQRTGVVGDYLGFSIYRDNQIPTHTTGTVTGDPSVSSAGAAQYATTIPIVTDSDDAVALKQGDSISFGDGNSYSVAADVSISASSSGDVTIYHGLEDALTSGDTLALSTGHGTGLVNVAGDMRGFGLGNRLPARDVHGVQPLGEPLPIVDPQSGVAMLLLAYPEYHRVAWEVCALWGTGIVDERKLCRVMSYSS